MDIQILTAEGVEFVVVVRLAASFLKALVRKSMTESERVVEIWWFLRWQELFYFSISIQL